MDVVSANRAAVALWALALFASMALGFVGWSPLSPLALDFADAALARGDVDLAAARYDGVGRYALRDATRVRALERAALVYAIELRDPGTAAARVEAQLALTEVPEERAALRDQIARHYQEQRRYSLAARVWSLAWDEDANPEYLAAAARAWRSSGDRPRAWAAWSRLEAGGGEGAALALLGKGHLSLEQGQVREALALYDRAARRATSDDIRAVARLGRVTCLEQLDEVDSAIAAMDEVALPDDAADRRLELLYQRRASPPL